MGSEGDLQCLDKQIVLLDCQCLYLSPTAPKNGSKASLCKKKLVLLMKSGIRKQADVPCSIQYLSVDGCIL